MNTTSLEDSKLLKAWGAPQDMKFFWVDIKGAWFDREWQLQEGTYEGDNVRIYDSVAAYDLESLIDWLGVAVEMNDHAVFFRLEWDNSTKKWLAKFPSAYKGHGSTPLEAVMNLCKAIHGKDTERPEGGKQV